MRTQIHPGLVMEYDDVGRGRPVVLLHAFPLSRAMWRPQLEALQADHRVIAPDLRGFGGSGGFDGEPSIETMADDVAALLDALNIGEPVVLGGLSMGGYVTLAFARRYAKRLRGLFLADSRSEPDNAEGKAARDKMIEFAKTHSAADVLEQMMPKMLSEETKQKRPEVIDEVRRIAANQTSAGVISGLQALRDRSDATPSLKDIRVPTLILVGSDDAITPPSMAESLAKAILGARLETIAGAGHLSNLERSDLFNAALRNFLREVESA